MVDQEEQQETFEKHLRISREFLSKAEQELEQGDHLQASEKFWGASAHMVKALASRRGWEHRSHAALYQVINRLASETGDEELRDLFLAAGQLHTNFYEELLPLEMVRSGAERVKELLARLEQVL